MGGSGRKHATTASEPSEDDYRTLYRIVAKDWSKIGMVVKKNGLLI
jgi:hypothetical protein